MKFKDLSKKAKTGIVVGVAALGSMTVTSGIGIAKLIEEPTGYHKIDSFFVEKKATDCVKTIAAYKYGSVTRYNLPFEKGKSYIGFEIGSIPYLNDDQKKDLLFGIANDDRFEVSLQKCEKVLDKYREKFPLGVYRK